MIVVMQPMKGLLSLVLQKSSKPIGAPVGAEGFVIEARQGWPAGVLAREEGRRSRVVQEQVLHRVEYVFSPFWSYPRCEAARSEARLPSPIP